LTETNIKLADIEEAYEHVFAKSRGTWDRNEPPDAPTLASIGLAWQMANKPDDKAKLREAVNDILPGYTLYPSGWVPPEVYRDLDYKLTEAGDVDAGRRPHATLPSNAMGDMDRAIQANIEMAIPKLKETVLSDQAFAVAEINRIVVEAAKPNLIGRELTTIWRTDRPTYRWIRAIIIPRAHDVGETGEVPSAGERYDNIDVTHRKIGVRPQISREMIEDAVWDVVARQVAEGGRAMAQRETEILLSLLNTLASSGNNFQGTGTETAAAAANVLAYVDIVKRLGDVRAKDFFVDTLVLHPTEETDILQDDKFIHAFYFGGLMRKALAPSETFGQVLGFRTLVSTLATSGRAIMMDSKRHAGLVIRRDVTAENLVDPVRDLQGVSFTERFNVAVLRHLASSTVTAS